MDHAEGLEGSGSALPVGDAQPIVSQAEALDETVPSGVIRPFTPMGSGSSIDHSQRNASDQPIQIGPGSSQAEAQIRA